MAFGFLKKINFDYIRNKATSMKDNYNVFMKRVKKKINREPFDPVEDLSIPGKATVNPGPYTKLENLIPRLERAGYKAEETEDGNVRIGYDPSMKYSDVENQLENMPGVKDTERISSFDPKAAKTKVYEKLNSLGGLRGWIAGGLLALTALFASKGIKDKIDYDKALNELGKANRLHLSVDKVYHLALKELQEKINEYQDKIAEAQKQKPNTTHIYQEGENPDVVARKYLEQKEELGREPTAAEVLEALNGGFLGDNDRRNVNMRNYQDIKDKLPVDQWEKPLKQNPNYVQEGAEWNIKHLLKNTIAKYEQLIQKLRSEEKNLKDEYKQKREAMLEMLEQKIEKYKKQIDNNDNWSGWFIASAFTGVAGTLTLLSMLYSRNKNREGSISTGETKPGLGTDDTIEDVIKAYRPRINQEKENYSDFANRIAKKYNKEPFELVFDNRYQGPKREELVKELLQNQETNDNRNGSYMSMNKIAEMTGMTRHQVAKLAKDKEISRKNIQRKIREDRYKNILLDAKEGLTPSELAEKHSYSSHYIKHLMGKYKLTRARNLKPI